MSDAIYPTLPGLTWPTRRAPLWKTTVKTSTSGRSWRRAHMRYPRYRISLQYNFLRSAAAAGEFQALFGFFNARNGGADNFLFLCPDDQAVTAQAFGVGNGAATQWQLVRALGGFVEPVYDLVAAPQLFANGVLLTSGYTISKGLVTFSTAPTAGVVLSWTGTYHWRCVFDADELTFERFMHQFWKTGEVRLITDKP
jgi:uncharacterized protein (TIGR02217 family)